MVPLNPNELSRAAAVASPHRGSTSPGMRNDPDEAIDARCAFSDARPAAAAAASRWPRFDLSDAHSSGPPTRAREAAPT